MHAFKGNLIWTEEPGRFRTIKDGYLLIEDGVVAGTAEKRPSEIDITDFGSSLILPGLYDLHIHAPQYMFAGLFMDDELLQWLDRHTFPLEARFSDKDFASDAYTAFVEDLKNSCTVRASIFGTIHRESTIMLMSLLEESGLHGYVGKISMDRNSPDILREDTDEAISEEIRFLEESSSFRNVKPIITPRFIPSCTDRLLSYLGAIAKERNLPVQTHLDENPSEVEWVRGLCPESRSYADAYDSFGLMDGRSIMAHSVWVTEEEMDLLSYHDAWVAHSPSSNMNLSSGIAPVRRFMERGIKTGLATDTAGGSSLSMFRMIQDAIAVSKLRWRFDASGGKALKFSEAFYLASKGGGSFFGTTGSFEKGYDADVVVIDDSRQSTILLKSLSVPERLEFYTYRHPDEFIKAKYVKGRRVL